MLKTQFPNKKTSDPETELQEAGKAVADLEQERALIEDRLREASASGDSAAIVKLQERARELPTHILARRLRSERLHLESIEAQLPDAATAFRNQEDERAKLHEAIKAAKAAKEQHFEDTRPIRELYSRLQTEYGDRRRRISLIEETLSNQRM